MVIIFGDRMQVYGSKTSPICIVLWDTFCSKKGQYCIERRAGIDLIGGKIVLHCHATGTLVASVRSCA